MAETSSDAPRAIWRTVVGRSEFAFISLLHSNVAGFLGSLEHLEALVKQRDRFNRESALFFLLSASLAFLLLINLQNLNVTFTSPIGSIGSLPISREFLLFGLSISTGYYAIRSVTVTLLSRQILAVAEHQLVGETSGHSASEHIAARWSASHLWLDVFRPRMIGYVSGLSHQLLILAVMLVVIMLAVCQLAIILSASYIAEQNLRGESSALAYWLIVIPSMISIHISLVAPILAMTVPIRFPWRPLPPNN